LLSAWLGGPHPIVILDLSGVPASILNDLIGTLLRVLYDALFWARDRSEGGRERPLLLVLEEAHVYLGKDHKGAAAGAVRRIAKEGRKYGIGAMIVSQRPSEVDDTILSQCGTLFALRMSNPSDRGHVIGTVTDNLQGLLSNLPILRTGEAVIVGEAVHLPMRALIEPPPEDRRPDSADPVIFGGRFGENDAEKSRLGGWDRGREPGDYQQVVEAWRLQQPRLLHPKKDAAKK
jgi:DNA helicase HerA-like ATPase